MWRNPREQDKTNTDDASTHYAPVPASFINWDTIETQSDPVSQLPSGQKLFKKKSLSSETETFFIVTEKKKSTYINIYR